MLKKSIVFSMYYSLYIYWNVKAFSKQDIREKMTVETGLIIVGGADDQLRLTNKKKRAELVTQTMVDKNIIEQIRTFLLGILLKQSQAAMERGEVKAGIVRRSLN